MKFLSRLAQSILLIMGALVLVALLVHCGAASAQGRQVREPVLQIQQPQYDAQVAAERRELLRILGRTRICMFDATTAIRQQMGKPKDPQRAEIIVRNFVKQTCGGQIRPFLVQWARWSEADADAFVDELVMREVAASTSWGTP